MSIKCEVCAEYIDSLTYDEHAVACADEFAKFLADPASARWL